jgi:peptidoglycan/LPS O-acetylase OafA/YrhL
MWSKMGDRMSEGESARPETAFKETQASVWLDGIRGLAAVLVLGEHWRNALFVDYPQLVAHRLLWLVPYLLTGAGRQMVVVFFVLSGYLVGGSVLKSVDARRWEWRRYLVHRLVRLWVVLLPGLLLCAFWDHAGLWLRYLSVFHLGAAGQRLAGDVRYAGLQLSPRVFLGNLVFLQGIWVPVYGTDSPLWSLSYEFWYYLLFPLGWLVVRGRSCIWMRLVYAALFLATAWFVGDTVLAMFPIWLLGALLAKMPRPKLGAAWRWAAMALSALAILFLAKYRGPGGMYGDYGVGLATFLGLWAALSAGERAEPGALQVRLARVLASFSYTLYVAHMPLLVLLTALAVGNGRWIPGATTVSLSLAILTVVLGYAYALAWATEFHTDRTRRRVEAWLVRRTVA